VLEQQRPRRQVPRDVDQAGVVGVLEAAPGQPQTVSVSIEGSPSMGQADAPLTLVEFADYQCPFCGRFESQTFGQLKANFIDKGLLRFVNRDLPLPFHGEAEKAALAARCAGDQGRYWEMRDALMKNSSTLSTDTMMAQATALSLNIDQFKTCMDTQQHVEAIRRDAKDAEAAGLTGTPSFVLGKASGNTVQGIAIIGAQPYQSFESKIKEMLPKE
jgi:protein-disulfide isomerase